MKMQQWSVVIAVSISLSGPTWAGSSAEQCGTFDLPRHFEFGDSLSSPLADDFDGDGDIDLVVTNEHPDFVP